MDRDLFSLVQEAKTWLASQSDPRLMSPEWHAHNQLQSFVALLEKDSSAQSLDFAIQSLRRYMVKNFDWSAESSKAVSRFCARADHIRRRLRGLTATAPSIEAPLAFAEVDHGQRGADGDDQPAQP